MRALEYDFSLKNTEWNKGGWVTIVQKADKHCMGLMIKVIVSNDKSCRQYTS